MISASSIQTTYIVLVVVRSEDRYLLIQEYEHGQLWFLPAGRVERGESLVKAAHREALEEGGLEIDLEGILRIEHSLTVYGSARLRIIFLARPKGDAAPKSQPDNHSLQARWVTLEELKGFPLRGDEVQEIFQYVAGGGAVYPLGLLTREGTPWPR